MLIKCGLHPLLILLAHVVSLVCLALDFYSKGLSQVYCLQKSFMFSDIILIGPVSTGKSTLGKLLAQRLGLPQCSMDEFRLTYYKEINYDEDLARQLR
jgi:2-phosphoglycerate kinase